MSVSLYPAITFEVVTGGTAVNAVYGPVLGGMITNPQLAADQGIAVIETLYLNFVGAASLGEDADTFPLQPGQSWVIPPGFTGIVSVNAATNGHKFSAYVIHESQPYPPPVPPGPFPPPGPVTMQNVIPSSLYQQYFDDDDLQAFVAAYNTLAQQYVTWLNDTPLAVYTADAINGYLLDWVGQSVLYGIPRPALSSGQNRYVGPFNTWGFNSFVFNSLKRIGPSNIVVTSDDFYKRIITWNYLKGDGRVFNVRWLKRRLQRFLVGVNGSNPNIDTTYQISVTFGLNRQVNITLVSGKRTVTGGAIFNRFAFNTKAFNQIDTTFQSFGLPNAAILKEALDSGVLQLPFQYDFVVNIS